MTRRTFALAPFLSVRTPAAVAPTLALTDLSIVDPVAGLRERQTIVLHGERITAVGSASTLRVPHHAKVVDARGRFLIPGLWDMHVHLSVAGASALPVLLANGVTGVRDMGGSPGELDRWRAAIAAGAMAGPRIFRAGPMLNGKAFNEYQTAVENAAEARGAVRVLHKTGADFVKVHAAITRDAWLGVAEECSKLGIPFAGHLPRAIRPEEASDAGQRSLEHLGTLFDGTLAAGVPPEELSGAISRFQHREATELFTQFARNGTYFTPTLVIERASIHLTSQNSSPNDRYISGSAKALTRQMQAKYKDLFTPAFVARQQRNLEASLPLVRLMHESGVRLLTGTDMGSSLLAPGYSLHQELAMLNDAGVPPLEILKAATQNSAQSLGLSDLGLIAEGKLADLVLLDANPLHDIRNTAKIRAVISRGKLYNRATLDALLHQGATAAAQNGG